MRLRLLPFCYGYFRAVAVTVHAVAVGNVPVVSDTFHAVAVTSLLFRILSVRL